MAWALAGCAIMEAAHAEQPADEPRATARTLADEGANAYSQRDYLRARTLFARAYELVPAPTVALWEARSLVELGRLVEAKVWYERASKASLDPTAGEPFRNAQQAAQAELIALTPRIPRLKLSVRGDAAKRAEVLLDEQRVPPNWFNTWRELDPGTHALGVQGKGVRAVTFAVRLDERDAKVATMQANADDTDPRRTAAWVGFGIGAVGLATGVGAGIVATNAHSDAERECSEGPCSPGSAGGAAVQRFRDFRTVSTLGYAIGAAGIGAGVALLLVSGRDEPVNIAIRPTLTGVRWEATW